MLTGFSASADGEREPPFDYDSEGTSETGSAAARMHASKTTGSLDSYVRAGVGIYGYAGAGGLVGIVLSMNEGPLLEDIKEDVGARGTANGEWWCETSNLPGSAKVSGRYEVRIREIEGGSHGHGTSFPIFQFSCPHGSVGESWDVSDEYTFRTGLHYTLEVRATDVAAEAAGSGYAKIDFWNNHRHFNVDEFILPAFKPKIDLRVSPLVTTWSKHQQEGTSVEVEACDPDGTIDRFEIQFGDSGSSHHLPSPKTACSTYSPPDHYYKAPGEYTIQACVYDNQDKESCKTQTVTITDDRPSGGEGRYLGPNPMLGEFDSWPIPMQCPSRLDGGLKASGIQTKWNKPPSVRVSLPDDVRTVWVNIKDDVMVAGLTEFTVCAYNSSERLVDERAHHSANQGARVDGADLEILDVWVHSGVAGSVSLTYGY